MRTMTVIVNPVAGRGRGERFLPVLSAGLKEAGVSHAIVVTTRPGEATEISRLAETETVVAVGGDGTANEVGNGLVGTDKVLGIIPTGSGNDLVKALGIPASPANALGVLLSGSVCTMDVGQVRVGSNSGSTNPTPRYFLNGIGIGFDAAVADRKAGIRYLSGFPLYLLAVLKTLGAYHAPEFSFHSDAVEFSGKKLLIAIGNGPCAAGRFYLTPRAKVDDGLFDYCAIRDLTVPQILQLMPKVLKGAHEGLPEVTMGRARHLIVKAATPFSVHADGEMVGVNVHSVEVELQEKSLQVVRPNHREYPA